MLIQRTKTVTAIVIASTLLACVVYAAPTPILADQAPALPTVQVVSAAPAVQSTSDRPIPGGDDRPAPATPPEAAKATPATAPAANVPAQIEPQAATTEDILEAPVAESIEQFRQALVSVYNNHPQIKAEREAVKVADEAVAQAVSGFRPNVGLGYERGRQRTSNIQDQWRYGDVTDKSLTATQPIFNGGEDFNNYKAARARVKAARARLLDTEQQIFSSAVAAYTDVVAKKLVLELNQNNVGVLGKQFEATKARFDVGDLTRTDVSQSEARRALAEADERQALGEYETAKVTFRRIIGYDPPDDLKMPPLPVKMPAALTEASAVAQANNPSLDAARFLERAANRDAMARAGAILPDVALQGTMSRSNRFSAFSDINRRKEDSLIVSVSIPLYQSGAEWSRIREARNLAQQAKFTTLDTRDAVIENVTRAWHDFHTAQAVISSTRESANSAGIALEGVRQENQYGVRTILDVLNAEQEFFFSKVDLVRAQAAEKAQAYRLLATMGKLTARDLGLPVEIYNPKEHYDSVKFQLIGL